MEGRDMESRGGGESDFDYAAALAELEEMAAKVESADTGIDDIDRYMRRSMKLVEECRAYLRRAREKLDALDEE